MNTGSLALRQARLYLDSLIGDHMHRGQSRAEAGRSSRRLGINNHSYFEASASLLFYTAQDRHTGLNLSTGSIFMNLGHAVNLVQRAAYSKACLPHHHCLFARTPTSGLTQRCWYRTRKSSPSPDECPDPEDSACVSEKSSPILSQDAPTDPDEVTGASPGALLRKARKPRKKRLAPTETADTLPKINPTSLNHHDLPTFLAHADSTALSRTSNVYVGTHYEYLTLASLVRLGFNLTRVGGASDLGIDLLGHWTLPSLLRPLPAIIQCKATTPQAVFIRELEGAMHSAPAGWRGEHAIGLLAASNVATKGVRDAMARSSVPMAFLCITADHGLVRQFIWNQAAVAKCGLEGVGVSLKYPDESIVLTYQGRPCGDLSPTNRGA